MPQSKRKAPKHPSKQETALKSVFAVTFDSIAKRLADTLAANDLDTVRELRAELHDKLDRDKFDDMVRAQVVMTAESARQQLADILGLSLDDFDPDMDAEIDEMIGNLHDIAVGTVSDILDRADGLLDEDDITPSDASDGIGGAIGTMGALVGMAFTYGFAKFNRAAQDDAGVQGYIWTSLHDDRVRDAHEHLDGIEFDWDDPPLGAAESSSGEDCHAGEDYNCRCTATPVVKAETAKETATDVGDEDVPDEVDEAA